jgi:hypothetical protein
MLGVKAKAIETFEAHLKRNYCKRRFIPVPEHETRTGIGQSDSPLRV